MKKLIALMLTFCFSLNSFAAVVCSEGVQGSSFEQCRVEEEPETSVCTTSTNEIVKQTTAEQHPIVCDNQSLIETPGHTADELDEIKQEYQKQCKKKAKAYKKALMGNLLKKGKLGQLVQVLFKKKKRKAVFQNGKAQNVEIDAGQFEGKSEQEVEDLILSELEKNSGISGLKERAKQAQEKPEFKLGYHQAESVPVNVVVQSKKKQACLVQVDKIPKMVEKPLDKCEFCVEKNISSSFTNDCSYMVNGKYSEAKGQELLGVKSKPDYCNHEMTGEENDMREIEKMTDRLCEIAKSGQKPEFTIETSRNLYKDKTPQLAAKRGEFIQKYIRNELQNGVRASGEKRCDLGDDSIDWLNNEESFNKSVVVKHPYYKDGKTGDYGPSPYAVGEEKQKKEVANLQATLAAEKETLKGKNAVAVQEKISSNAKVIEYKAQIKKITADYDALTSSLNKIKQIDESVFAAKKKLEEMSMMVQQFQNKINETRQAVSDLDLQTSDFGRRLGAIDSENASKVKLLGEYYAEKNKLGDVADKKSWDDKLFNSFKMVRITGKAVEDNVLGVDPQYLTPAVKIALNAMVDVDNFTCVVEPIRTHKTSLKGVLKGGLKVLTVLASPVVLAAGAGAAVVAAPFTFTGSFFCQGCGNPGNIPPVLRFGNPRSLDLSKGARHSAKADIKDAWDSYVNWGGLLDVNKSKNSFENSTQDVYEEQQKRLSN
jgi:hypothetical protein